MDSGVFGVLGVTQHLRSRLRIEGDSSLVTHDQFRSSDLSNSGMKTELERYPTAAPAATIEREMSSRLGCPMNNVSSGYLEFSFGPFRLIPEQQLLVEDGKQVNVGARVLELLRVLVEHSGKVVSKDELIACMWPDTCGSESNLKVQIAALRRALGEGRRGERYVATVNGRGYRFVAPVKRQDAFRGQGKTAAVPENNLVPGWIRLLGHDQILDALTGELSARRFITVGRPGGVGQTTVGLALADLLVGGHRDGLSLVELVALRDSHLVQAAIAAALAAGISAEAGAEALPSVLHHKSVLIVLDYSDHLAAADRSTSNQSASEAA
jgi:DNA-binding winged helix-turn-helix (wHTH) protein